jgi:hypothetical protein
MSLTIFTSYSYRAKYFALSSCGAGAGLLFGPGISSLSQFVDIGMSPTVLGSVWVLALGALFLAFLVMVFPGQNELFALADLDMEEAFKNAQGHFSSADGSSHDSTPTSHRRAWMGFITGLVVNFLRIYLRLAWESGIAVVITLQFYDNTDAGVRATGFWVALPLCLYVPAQLFFGYITKGIPIEVLSKWVLLLEFLGIVGMFGFMRIPEEPGSAPWLAAISVIACGSGVFYAANQFNGALFTTWMTKFDLASHPVLNREGIVCASVYAITIGYMFGPSLVRLILASVASRTLLASSLLVGVVLQGVCSEVGIHFAEHGEAPSVK